MEGKGIIWDRYVRKIVRVMAWTALGLFALSLLVSIGTTFVARRYVYHDISQLPKRQVAVVLGTTPYATGGGLNPYFTARMDAAAQLYAAGKVTQVLVSGDNRDFRYNEPKAMRKALEARGVPSVAIHEDLAGIDTLDSVLRARDVFGVVAPVYVTQRFHADRAIAMARWSGIPAVAFIVPENGNLRTRLYLYAREYLARLKMAWQLLWGAGPQVSGVFAPFSKIR